MATAQFAQRATPLFKSETDFNTFFDFDQGIAPVSRAPSAQSSVRPGPSQTHTTSSYQDDDDNQQIFAGPSHEYDRFPQQTGVVAGDVRGLANINQPMPDNFDFGGFNSGIDESSFGMWDMDSDMNMDMNNPGMFNKFVDPSYIENEEPQSHVGRLWPGMHQQAAIAKTQQPSVQQFHHQPQQQQQQLHQGKGKGRAAQPSDPHTEESISRLLDQMRKQSVLSSVPEDDTISQSGFMSGMGRSRKDEEDMDEDERLLASDEGKKLSSKERRQLRNKVSARAFRSRRKEYIGQLEGEVAVKAQEASQLKSENTALTEENARYRALIQTLLRHPSFTPFIDDLSKDPAFIASQVSTSQARSSATPSAQPQQVKAQSQIPNRMPEAPVDLSMLNLNNTNFSVPQNMMFDANQARFFQAQSLQQQQQGSYF